MRHVIPISGKDSLCAALIQTARREDLSYEFVFCDVGAELPETYEWLDRVEAETGWTIQRIGKSLEGVIRKYNMLPSRRRRFCTREAKIGPLESFHGSDTTVYYGLRADESRVGARPSDSTTHVYPLVEFGIGLRGVWTILARKNLLPPAFFWPSLYYRVRELLGVRTGLIDQLEEWEFRMLFAGRTRANCYFCFFQRRYEYVWLAETHPELFERLCWMERFTGGSLTTFTWLKGFYIDNKVRNERRRLLNKRARAVCQMVLKRFDTGLFEEHGDTELALTSCGLLCGK